MRKTNINIFQFIKYLLISILAILSIYLILLLQGLINRPYPPKNSIEVSPKLSNSINIKKPSNIIFNIK